MTHDVLSFAFVGQDREIDAIPLAEVEYVKEFKGLSQEDEEVEMNISEVEEATSQHGEMLQIATSIDGFNSGRNYYLRSDTEDVQTLVRTLQKLCLAAKKRAESRTFAQMLQRKIRIFYSSDIIQGLLTILIAGVGVFLWISPRHFALISDSLHRILPAP